MKLDEDFCLISLKTPLILIWVHFKQSYSEKGRINNNKASESRSLFFIDFPEAQDERGSSKSLKAWDINQSCT